MAKAVHKKDSSIFLLIHCDQITALYTMHIIFIYRLTRSALLSAVSCQVQCTINQSDELNFKGV